MSDDVSFGSVGTTDAVSALIEELQFMLGEGPCIDAYDLEVPIAEPDLDAPSSRWPGFTPPALEAGVRAIFSFHFGWAPSALARSISTVTALAS